MSAKMRFSMEAILCNHLEDNEESKRRKRPHENDSKRCKELNDTNLRVSKKLFHTKFQVSTSPDPPESSSLNASRNKVMLLQSSTTQQLHLVENNFYSEEHISDNNNVCLVNIEKHFNIKMAK
ncbi:unnamed protein product [Thelazia callipaeda]|uniref:Uncharacterized protein n=1 Tax=Thelazia callipaeda TaxID=103827 RepID=A0A0N5D121_THECL|nr:unnamed protein product [Thelazia callipaeda]